jgi:hypothetical protein
MLGACTPGRVELDHIDNAGHGKRGPSTPLNLVSLCADHHQDKTENTRKWRPILREYARLAEDGMDPIQAARKARAA